MTTAGPRRHSIAASAVLIACLATPALASEGPATPTPAAATSEVRIAANFDVPAARTTKAAPDRVAVYQHRRRIALQRPRPLVVPPAVTQVAYRPLVRTACSGTCGAPILLILGISY